jgi:hypothetical protein
MRFVIQQTAEMSTQPSKAGANKSTSQSGFSTKQYTRFLGSLGIAKAKW